MQNIAAGRRSATHACPKFRDRVRGGGGGLKHMILSTRHANFSPLGANACRTMPPSGTPVTGWFAATTDSEMMLEPHRVLWLCDILLSVSFNCPSMCVAVKQLQNAASPHMHVPMKGDSEPRTVVCLHHNSRPFACTEVSHPHNSYYTPQRDPRALFAVLVPSRTEFDL